MEDQTSTPLYVARIVHHGAIQSPTKLATRMIQSTDRLNEIKASLQQLVTHPETQATANDTLGKINQQIEGHRKLETLLVQVGAIGEFIYFSKLPLELRTMVWLETLPKKQVMNVSWIADNQFDANGKQIPVLACKTPPVAMSHVCSESRQVAFTILSGVLSGGYGQQRQFRYNPSRDLVYVSMNFKENFVLEDCVAFWSTDTLRLVKNLAVDSRIMEEQLCAYEDEYLDRGKVDMVLIAGFWRLEKLIVIVHGHDFEVHDTCRKEWTDTRSPGYARTSDNDIMSEFKALTKELIKFEKKAMRRRGTFYSHHNPQIVIRVGLRDGELCCHGDSRLLGY